MAVGVLTNPMTSECFVRLPAPPDRLRIEVQAPPRMVRPPSICTATAPNLFKSSRGAPLSLSTAPSASFARGTRWRLRLVRRIRGGTRATGSSDL
jgi:hypothetical protein